MSKKARCTRRESVVTRTTAIVRITCFDTGPCELFLKLESSNPTGSIKDRIAVGMIQEALITSSTRRDITIIEATSGNTGIALAQLCTAMSLRLLLVVPDKISAAKLAQLNAFGAEVILTRSDLHEGDPGFYRRLAHTIASRMPHAIYLNQFNNVANVRAHERRTAPELWRQMDHRLDTVVCGIGTGGTLAGLTRFFSRVTHPVDIVLADPEGSSFAQYLKLGVYAPAHSYLVEGIGGEFLPPLVDVSSVREVFSISDGESLATARFLFASTGILAGPATGTLLAAALKYCRKQLKKKRVATFATDSGTRYLSALFGAESMPASAVISRPYSNQVALG